MYELGQSPVTSPQRLSHNNIFDLIFIKETLSSHCGLAALKALRLLILNQSLLWLEFLRPASRHFSSLVLIYWVQISFLSTLPMAPPTSQTSNIYAFIHQDRAIGSSHTPQSIFMHQDALHTRFK